MTKLKVIIVLDTVGMLLILGGITDRFVYAHPLSYAAISTGSVLIAVGMLLYSFIITRKKS